MSENPKMITSEELAALRAPFSLDKHIAREGIRNKAKTKIRWFIYIDRSAVEDRLDEIFPGEWGNPEPKLYTLGSTISATVGISIRGITRWDGGDDDSGEGAKGALTNGFRRVAAYGWNIARYLYDMDDQIWTDSYTDGDWDAQRARQKEAFDKFVQWYNRRFGNRSQKPATTPPQKPPVTAAPHQGTSEKPWSPAEQGAFWTNWTAPDNAMTLADMQKALGIINLSEWKRSAASADTAMEKYIERQVDEAIEAANGASSH